MSSIAAPALAPSRRAWLTDLPVLLVAVVRGSSYLAAKGITTAQTVLAVLVLRFAVVLSVAGRRRLRALPLRLLHALRLLRADVVGTPHLAVPGRPAARHGTAVAAAVGIAIGGERLGVCGAAGAVLVLAGTALGRRALTPAAS